MASSVEVRDILEPFPSRSVFLLMSKKMCTVLYMCEIGYISILNNILKYPKNAFDFFFMASRIACERTTDEFADDVTDLVMFLISERPKYLRTLIILMSGEDHIKLETGLLALR